MQDAILRVHRRARVNYVKHHDVKLCMVDTHSTIHRMTCDFIALPQYRMLEAAEVSDVHYLMDLKERNVEAAWLT